MASGEPAAHGRAAKAGGAAQAGCACRWTQTAQSSARKQRQPKWQTSSMAINQGHVPPRLFSVGRRSAARACAIARAHCARDRPQFSPAAARLRANGQRRRAVVGERGRAQGREDGEKGAPSRAACRADAAFRCVEGAQAGVGGSPGRGGTSSRSRDPPHTLEIVRAWQLQRRNSAFEWGLRREREPRAGAETAHPCARDVWVRVGDLGLRAEREDSAEEEGRRRVVEAGGLGRSRAHAKGAAMARPPSIVLPNAYAPVQCV